MPDTKKLLQELKAAFSSELVLPPRFLDQVLLATDRVFEKHAGLERGRPSILREDGGTRDHSISDTRFDGINNNLFSALPRELRLKVIEYCLAPIGESDDDSEEDIGWAVENMMLGRLQKVFPNDDLIEEMKNSKVIISFSDDDYHVPKDGSIGDFEILNRTDEFFQYKPVALLVSAPVECVNMGMTKFLKIMEKEKNLQSIRMLILSSFTNIFQLHFDTSTLDLKNLEVLQLDSTKIWHIKDLQGFPNLRKLSCSHTSLLKVDNIGYLTKLETLNLSDNALEKIPSTINKLTSLRNLGLLQNNISKIENLYNLKKLISLELDSNRIQAIENLNACTSLKKIYLGGNHDIIQIQNLDSLTQLRMLNLNGTSILKMENLSKLSNLERLELCNTNISRLENLENLRNLKTLLLKDCRNGSFKQFENLANLKSLVELQISPCQDITSLEGIGNLINLKSLTMNGHSLTTIKNVAGLKNLETLDLSFGTLDNVGDLNSLTKLTRIDFTFNKIRKVGDLSKLESLDAFRINERFFLRLDHKSSEAFFKRLASLRNDELDDSDMEYFNDIRRMVFSDPVLSYEEDLDTYPDFESEEDLNTFFPSESDHNLTLFSREEFESIHELERRLYFGAD